ncbi:MAG: serine/threonine-protein phosphatase [Leptospiraceae bacterium]|nr:serine/threonine-protein phosphatase [Leptospiraceae bacterium]
MLNNFIFFFKSIYVNVPSKHRREFADKLRTENLTRLKVMALFILFLTPFMGFAHFQLIEKSYCSKIHFYCETLFAAHYSSILYALIYLVIYKYTNPKNWHRFFSEILVLFSILFYLSIFSISSLAAQFFKGNIVFFTTGSVFMAALFVTFKRYATLIYFLTLASFIVGLYKFQHDKDLLLLNNINSTIAIFFAYSLNLIFFHYKLDDFLKSKTIVQKNLEINRTLDDLKRDISVAKKIQGSLMQKSFHDIKNLIFEVSYIPLDEVGGDIYDISEINRKYTRIFLADATGHGVQAALITMAIKGEYESFKHSTSSPKKLLKSLNNDFVQKFGAIHSFFSCIVVDIYPDRNKLIYASAGHPDQILQKKNWEIQNLSRTGKIMGLMKDIEFEEVEIPFERGDKLFLFTDGLFEEFNSNKEEFGEKQVLSIIKAYSDKDLKELFAVIMENLNSFLANASRQDDITFIGIEHDYDK